MRLFMKGVCMNYQQFVTEVTEKVKNLLDDSLRVEVVSTLKNNGAQRIGLSITDSTINISPTIYLEEFYHYHNCMMSLDYIAQEIISLYDEIRFDHDVDLDHIQNFSLAKHAIGYKLINASLNQEFLEKIPHKRYFEFAIVFILFVEPQEYNHGTIVITNDLIKYWKTSIEEIYEIAYQNMPAIFPVSLVPMHDMVCELLDDNDTDFLEDSPLYILTNKYRVLGASVLLYNNTLSYVAQKLKENFYILRSSIHELIIVPESRSPQIEELNKMVKEVNETQILPEEILGERAYYYDAMMNRLF